MEPFIAQIMMFGGNFAPRGWAFCDGQLLSISSYSALFSILGTTYGGDGRTTFGLPDLRSRVPVHAGSGPGLTPRKLGQRSGSETNTLTTAQLPSHNHAAQIPCTTQNGDQSSPADNVMAETEGGANIYSDTAETGEFMKAPTIGNTGGSQAVNNMQPFLCVNYIIALQGTFPSRS